MDIFMAKPKRNEHFEQTSKVIDLAVAQIEVAIDESNGSMKILTDSLFSVTDKFEDLDAKIRVMKEQSKLDITDFETQCNAVVSDIKAVVIASQFYDRLSQRLHHISDSLQSLSIGLEQQQPSQALSILDKTKKSYTMPEEDLIFDWVMEGKTLKEILILSSNHKVDNSEGEIDLF
jgi:hypothetical protein